MAKYIYQRNKVYYFKMRIPTAFVSKLGFNEIHKTLKTSSRPIAKRRAAKLKHKLNKFFNYPNSTLSRDGIGKIIADVLIQENDQDSKTSIPQKNYATSPKEILQKIISGESLHTDNIPNGFLMSMESHSDGNGNIYRIL